MNMIMTVTMVIVIAYLIYDIAYDIYLTYKKKNAEKERWARLFAITKLK